MAEGIGFILHLFFYFLYYLCYILLFFVMQLVYQLSCKILALFFD